ncbi:hypothetical protein EYF80_042784 [Liparis tanakae]|uniref:Uncharacterized protein n=1 Tax=Liparis tanakae TaxID=230148 RepID=A0A4Z2G292_9TELE|nr:hypothetical protein EYF80_042784 [Liparis tanakae]
MSAVGKVQRLHTDLLLRNVIQQLRLRGAAHVTVVHLGPHRRLLLRAVSAFAFKALRLRGRGALHRLQVLDARPVVDHQQGEGLESLPGLGQGRADQGFAPDVRGLPLLQQQGVVVLQLLVDLLLELIQHQLQLLRALVRGQPPVQVAADLLHGDEHAVVQPAFPPHQLTTAAGVMLGGAGAAGVGLGIAALIVRSVGRLLGRGLHRAGRHVGHLLDQPRLGHLAEVEQAGAGVDDVAREAGGGPVDGGFGFGVGAATLGRRHAQGVLGETLVLAFLVANVGAGHTLRGRLGPDFLLAVFAPRGVLELGVLEVVPELRQLHGAVGQVVALGRGDVLPLPQVLVLETLLPLPLGQPSRTLKVSLGRVAEVQSHVSVTQLLVEALVAAEAA